MRISSGSRALSPDYPSKKHLTCKTCIQTTPRTRGNRSHTEAREVWEAAVRIEITSPSHQVFTDITHPLEVTMRTTSCTQAQVVTCALTVPQVVRIFQSTPIGTGALRVWTATGSISRWVATTVTIATLHPTAVNSSTPPIDIIRYG